MITKKCTVSDKDFTITESDLGFYVKMEIISNEDYKKLKSRKISDCVGLPTLCPEERQRRRLSWQNMRNLYWTECTQTHKKVLSNYSPDKNIVIYDQEFWWSDNHDFLDFGIDFDFSKTFFENYEILMRNAPIPNLFTNYLDDENSKFTNFAGYDKNCYLIFHGDFNEDCSYATGIKNCKDCTDGINIFQSELLYECIDCLKCYDLKFSQDCKNCSESWFLKNCFGCSHCFGCINLRNKEYFLFNKKVSREKYEKFIEEFESGKASVIAKLFEQFTNFQATQFHPALHGYQNEDCEGDHIFKSKNCQHCFDVQESRDMKFCERIYNGPNSDCYDVDQFGAKIQYVYEAGPIGQNSYMTGFAMLCYALVDSFYCQNAFNSKNCFGCFGVKGAKYCIFNKQYSKEEYFKLREKIIQHMKKTKEWGEYFPIELSPFGYNETIAQEYFPLTEKEILAKNLKYHEQKQHFKYEGPKYIIPDNIEDVEDEILNKILTCEKTGKHYKIQKSELRFYRKMNLPIPRFCSDERHRQRMMLKNPRKLHDRNCDSCSGKIKTTFSPDRPEKVYCEKCYLNEVN